MERIIKFRCWNGKEMLMPDLTDWEDVAMELSGDLFRSYETGIERWRTRDWLRDVKLMQFTGLTDKNGVEIYEGDVVNTPNNNWGVIVWSAPFFEVTVSETQSSLYTREWMGNCEVIGNIYSHPHLLTQQKQ